MSDQRKLVLLSSSPANQELAALVESLIREAGFAVRSELPGAKIDQDYAEVLREAVATCDAVTMLVTPDAATSEWLPFEVGLARALDKPVIVLFDGLRRRDLPVYLAEFRVAGVSQVGSVLRRVACELQAAG